MDGQLDVHVINDKLTFWKYFTNILMWLPGWKNIHKSILQLQYMQACNIEHSLIKALVWIFAISDTTMLQEAAVTFCHKCPIHPNRTSRLNPISDMEE